MTETSDQNRCTSIELEVTIDALTRMKLFVHEVVDTAGMNTEDGQQLRLAVEEAVMNIISYSHAHWMALNSDIKENAIWITIADDGLPFDPTKAPPPDFTIPGEKRKEGGLGIYLVREITDSVSYDRHDGRNYLTIKKFI